MSAVRAALTINHELMKAQANNYYEHGWYAYMARWDVESVVDCVQQIQALVESNERLTKTKLRKVLHG